MKIDFRFAKPSDAEEIQKLYQQLVNDKNINVTTAGIKNLVEDRSNFLVVGESEGQVVATALFTLCRDVMYGDQPFAVIENIVVSSNCRGSGYGSALMSHLKTLGREHRCTKIMLLSSASRSEAHTFFEKCGYRGDLKRGFVNYINR